VPSPSSSASQGGPEVVCLGHAIVDVVARCSEEAICELGLVKGTMTLVEPEVAGLAYAKCEPVTQVSGGSAANTAACVASLGGSARFVGKVGSDPLGELFEADIVAAGVTFSKAVEPSAPTGTCLVLVTPDAEKTMCTSLGAGALLEPTDVDVSLSRAAAVYLEGYACAGEATGQACRALVASASSVGVPVALSASDPLLVRQARGELLGFLNQAQLLFCNEEEALGLADAHELDQALDTLAGRCPFVVITLGPKGAVVVSPEEKVRVGAQALGQVVDTTGAGDSFAGGFLFGWVRGMELRDCAALGALAAGEVVGHFGARPSRSLSELARSLR